MELLLLLGGAAAAATVGDMLLSAGMRRIVVESAGPRALLRAVGAAARSGLVLAGVALLIVYFVLFLASLSRAAVSLVVPATAATYALTALLARAFLRERISRRRGVGISLIALGVVLVGLG